MTLRQNFLTSCFIIGSRRIQQQEFYQLNYSSRGSQGHINILKPNISSRVQTNQLRQKSGYDQDAKDRYFRISDPVFVRNFATTGPTWLPRIVIESRGDLTFRVFCRHIDHIRQRTCSTDNAHTDNETEDFLPPTTDHNYLLYAFRIRAISSR